MTCMDDTPSSSSDIPGAQPPPETRAKPRRSGLLLPIAAGLVGILVGASAVYAVDHLRGSSTPGVGESPFPRVAANTAAVVRCERAVDAELRAPTQPQYHDVNAWEEAGNAGWWIEGSADVMNGSGGYSTVTWRCYYLDDEATADLTSVPASPSMSPG